MSAGKHRTDVDIIAHDHNSSRFFVENRQLAWVLLVTVVATGLYGYSHMPQRKDPDVPSKQAKVIVPWPGASAEEVEEQVTRTIEQTVSSNSNVSRIESVSRPGRSEVTIALSDSLGQTGQTLDDIGGRLSAITNLPQGAGPVNYERDFGDTATILLTVASPKASPGEIQSKTNAITAAIRRLRQPSSPDRIALVFCFPRTADHRLTAYTLHVLAAGMEQQKALEDVRFGDWPGYAIVDGRSKLSEQQLLSVMRRVGEQRFHAQEFQPDVWRPVAVRELDSIGPKLQSVAGDKYSYREMDDMTDRLANALLATSRKLNNAPLVSKVTRSGVLSEKVFLLYSQSRLAAYGLKPDNLKNALAAYNVTAPAGDLDLNTRRVGISASGQFRNEKEIGEVVAGITPAGTPIHLRDVLDISRGYDNPPSYLEFLRWRDANGKWQRSRSVSLSIQMGASQKVQVFSDAVNRTLADARKRLPEDLIMARTSDQPEQVKQNLTLFMNALYEAIGLVVLVSLVGFWEWRSAFLMALAIPITLLMTFGMVFALGVDLQQVSIATLIIALGLLVDDPVVAGDSIKRSLAAGHPPVIAAWLGPTKLAKAIVYATVTNVVAYVPFLLLTGSTGQFLRSLPVVLGCSLLASRVASMTFVPLLGYCLLKPKPEMNLEESRKTGLTAWYYDLGRTSIRYRWAFLLGSFVVLALGSLVASTLTTRFFPSDLSKLAYIDINLPEDAPISAADQAAQKAEHITLQAIGRQLASVNTYVGGGSPRFWYSLSPEARHANYAELVLLFRDEHDTESALGPLQARLSKEVIGARVDVRQLETGDAVGLPIQIRVSGPDIQALRHVADEVAEVIRSVPTALRVRDNWGDNRIVVNLDMNSDRANLAGITNLDTVHATDSALSGQTASVLYDANKQIPIVTLARPDERVDLSDIQNLYAYSSQGTQKVPLRAFARFSYSSQIAVIRRLNNFRTITVSAVPRAGVVPSEIMKIARPHLARISAELPSGYRIEIGGEEEKQVQGFRNLTQVLLISVAAIYMALAFQFKNAVKPLIVFSAVPYGACGSLFALWMTHTAFGFMAFLGVVSLVGVIISHIIVLFDFIEERHELGEDFELAVLDAGIIRLRPVLITVGATVSALIPLAIHGGPLWQPLCYAQIGGLLLATIITKLYIPVMYSICVLDLKIVNWNSSDAFATSGSGHGLGTEAAPLSP